MTERLGPCRMSLGLLLQGIISLVCQAADSHFGLVLETLTTFAATSCSGRGLRVSRRRKVRCLGFPSLAVFHLLFIVGCGGPWGGRLTASLATQTTQASRRAEATCRAVMLAHSSMALRASKEQLLAHVEADIAGNILLLSISSSQVRARGVQGQGCWVQSQLQALRARAS